MKSLEQPRQSPRQQLVVETCEPHEAASGDTQGDPGRRRRRRSVANVPSTSSFTAGPAPLLTEIRETLDYGVVRTNVDTDTQYAFTRPIAGHMFANYDGVLKVDGDVGDKKACDTLVRQGSRSVNGGPRCAGVRGSSVRRQPPSLTLRSYLTSAPYRQTLLAIGRPDRRVFGGNSYPGYRLCNLAIRPRPSTNKVTTICWFLGGYWFGSSALKFESQAPERDNMRMPTAASATKRAARPTCIHRPLRSESHAVRPAPPSAATASV